MIVVRITMNVIPIKQKELVQTLRPMMASMKKEVGYMSLDLSCNIEDENFLTLIEEWQTREELDRHLKSNLFGVLLGANTLLWESPLIQIHTVSQSERVEAIDVVRNRRNQLMENKFKIS